MEPTTEFVTLTDTLLSKERVVEDLTVLDQFMLAYHTNKGIALDPDMNWLYPAFYQLKDDQQAFLRWLSYLVTERKANPFAEDKPELRHLKRTVYQRVYMDLRRERLRKGILLLEAKLGRKIEAEDLPKYEAVLIGKWMDSRDEYVKKHGGSKISYDEKLHLYNVYWEKLDRKLAKLVADL